MVGFLKADPKARYQGYTFYFKEGFCWSNVSTPINEESMYIKCRIKEKSVNDVASMSLTSYSHNCPDYYICSLLNSGFLFHYLKTFINTTVNLQINDFRLFPIIVPNRQQLEKIKLLYDNAINIKKLNYKGGIHKTKSDFKLNTIQKELEMIIEELYEL